MDEIDVAHFPIAYARPSRLPCDVGGMAGPRPRGNRSDHFAIPPWGAGGPLGMREGASQSAHTEPHPAAGEMALEPGFRAASRLRQAPAPYSPSKTSRTFAINPATEYGFSMKNTPGSSMPRCAMTSAVCPDM
jgi:hypothetical protein